MLRRRQIGYRSTSRLIKEVKKYPCIWDREHEQFNNRYNVGLAWKRIARRLRLSEKAVKVKWMNLWNTFKQEIKINPLSLTDYSGNWAFFREMLFIINPEKQESEADIEAEYLEIHDEEHTTEIELQDERPDEYYDLLFLESLAPYFKELEPVRKLAVRSKIQNMLMKEISIQNNEYIKQDKRDLVYLNTVKHTDMTDLNLL